MNFVSPIKDRKTVESMIDYWFEKSQKERGYTPKRLATRNAFLIELGIFLLGMRISDIRLLKVKDVLGKDEITFVEQKHANKKDGAKNKKSNLVQHRQVPLFYRDAIKHYVKTQKLKPDDYLFFSRQSNPDGTSRPIGRVQAFNIITEAGRAIGLDIEVSTHTLRKTFAHLIYMDTKDLTFVQKLLCHRDSATTIKYLGYDKEHEVQILSQFNSSKTRWS